MSIKDIARMAGVSVSSVSNYFNRPERVGVATAARIRAAVARTDYKPDARRPGPKTGDRVGVHTGNVAFFSLYREPPAQFLMRPGIPQLLGGVRQALDARGLNLLLAGTGEQGELPGGLDARSCDGVIVFGGASLKPLAHLRAVLGELPAVRCFYPAGEGSPEWEGVAYDNRRAGEIAAEFLFRQGHRRVAVFNSDDADAVFRRRLASFRRVVRSYRMEVAEFTVPAASSLPRALRCRNLAEQFRRSPAAPTGMFFCSDDTLAGVCRELRGGTRELELRHVVGCNADEMVLDTFAPRPATVDLRFAEIGRLAVERLIARLRGMEPDGPETVVRPMLAPGQFGDPARY